MHRIMPLVKNDGTLMLIERLIDKQYAGQINDFITDLISEQENLSKYIRSIVIDGIQI